MSDNLTPFWVRADLEDAAFTGDEVRRLAAASRHLLESHSLLRASESLPVIECDACGDGHLEAVETFVEPAGSQPRAYIACPEVGRVSVDRERLQLWSVDMNAVASTIATALALDGQIVSITPGRIWLLGKQRVGGRLAEFFLARGTRWPDSVPVLQAASRLQASPAPIILCPSHLPGASEWYQAGRTLFSLAEHVAVEQSRLAIDVKGFEDLHRQIAAGADKPPDPTPLAQRAALLKRYRTANGCLIKDVCFWASVVREDLNKWKLGHVHLIPNTSEKAIRIERLLQRDEKSRV